MAKRLLRLHLPSSQFLVESAESVSDGQCEEKIDDRKSEEPMNQIFEVVDV